MRDTPEMRKFHIPEERKEAVSVVSLMKIASLWTVGESASVVTSWQHAGGKSRRSSDTKRTLEREIALIGEKAFCIRDSRFSRQKNTSDCAYNTYDENKNERIIEASTRCARKTKDSEDKRVFLLACGISVDGPFIFERFFRLFNVIIMNEIDLILRFRMRMQSLKVRDLRCAAWTRLSAPWEPWSRPNRPTGSCQK